MAVLRCVTCVHHRDNQPWNSLCTAFHNHKGRLFGGSGLLNLLAGHRVAGAMAWGLSDPKGGVVRSSGGADVFQLGHHGLAPKSAGSLNRSSRMCSSQLRSEAQTANVGQRRFACLVAAPGLGATEPLVWQCSMLAMLGVPNVNRAAFGYETQGIRMCFDARVNLCFGRMPVAVASGMDIAKVLSKQM